ncbi:MAG: NrfD/PsrC family molybdoenzyme membrane anchor subunit [Planctomycetota bacterium]
MDPKFERLEGRSPQYWSLLALLGALAVAGFLVTWYASVKGLWVTGMTNRIPWGLQIVMAVYYIGFSEGCLVVAGLYGVFGKQEYKPFARMAVFLAMLFLIAGLLSILTDQGRMDRVFVETFIHFNFQSMFSINPLLYLGHILICILFLFVMFKQMDRLVKVVATMAFAWAFCVHSGTGAIFGFGARVLYESPMLPATFVAAAMASGIALMIVMVTGLFKLTNRHVDDALILWLGKLMAVTLTVVVYLVFVENAYRAYVFELREAAHFYLFGGFHSVLFWLGLVCTGLIGPMLILFHPKLGKSVRWVVVASLMVMAGVLCERYVIVLPGLLHPPDLFPGMEIIASEVNEGVASYTVSWVEVVQALGVAGFIGFLFLWGIKVLSFLPKEARAPSL